MRWERKGDDGQRRMEEWDGNRKGGEREGWEKRQRYAAVKKQHIARSSA